MEVHQDFKIQTLKPEFMRFSPASHNQAEIAKTENLFFNHIYGSGALLPCSQLGWPGFWFYCKHLSESKWNITEVKIFCQQMEGVI